jgi:hypothetical protein
METTDQTNTPPKQKTEAGKILAGIAGVITAPFNWGVKEFGVIAKSFAGEDPKIQADLAAVSGMLQIIKLNLSETPVVIIYLVKKAYPQFDEAKILALLQSGITDLSLAEKIVGEDLPSFLTSLAQHVLGTTDTGWKLFWDGLFKAVSMVAVPGTIWEKIVTYALYVYNVLVKPTVK